MVLLLFFVFSVYREQMKKHTKEASSGLDASASFRRMWGRALHSACAALAPGGGVFGVRSSGDRRALKHKGFGSK